jgi:protein arginine N-methyltransferase 1
MRNVRWVRSLLDEEQDRRSYMRLFGHEVMLADAVRMEAYETAIHAEVRPTDVVVDLGTGTGILAYLAGRAARHVYAIDASDFIFAAERVLRLNAARNVTVIQTDSRRFEPPEPVDVIVHEQMGGELLNEGLLETIVDLRDRALRPGGRILPRHMRLYAEPVSLRPDSRVPFLTDQRLMGLDFGVLRDDPRLTCLRDERYWWREVQTGEVDQVLSDPQPLVAFDLTSIQLRDLPVTVDATRTIVKPGALDALAVWFEAGFDSGPVLTTHPLAPRTHWKNALFRLAGGGVAGGDVLRYRVRVGALGIEDVHIVSV